MVNRKVIQKMLQRYGASVEAVVGGPQGVEKMRPGHHFDCVLMDVQVCFLCFSLLFNSSFIFLMWVFVWLQMPGMDGFQATTKIREEEVLNGMPRTPIFALTADIFYGTREKATESGMDGFLSKPIEEDQLWGVIKKFFPSGGSADMR